MADTAKANDPVTELLLQVRCQVLRVLTLNAEELAGACAEAALREVWNSTGEGFPVTPGDCAAFLNTHATSHTRKSGATTNTINSCGSVDGGPNNNHDEQRRATPTNDGTQHNSNSSSNSNSNTFVIPHGQGFPGDLGYTRSSSSSSRPTATQQVPGHSSEMAPEDLAASIPAAAAAAAAAAGGSAAASMIEQDNNGRADASPASMSSLSLADQGFLDRRPEREERCSGAPATLHQLLAATFKPSLSSSSSSRPLAPGPGHGDDAVEVVGERRPIIPASRSLTASTTASATTFVVLDSPPEQEGEHEREREQMQAPADAEPELGTSRPMPTHADRGIRPANDAGPGEDASPPPARQDIPEADLEDTNVPPPEDLEPETTANPIPEEQGEPEVSLAPVADLRTRAEDVDPETVLAGTDLQVEDHRDPESVGPPVDGQEAETYRGLETPVHRPPETMPENPVPEAAGMGLDEDDREPEAAGVVGPAARGDQEENESEPEEARATIVAGGHEDENDPEPEAVPWSGREMPDRGSDWGLHQDGSRSG